MSAGVYSVADRNRKSNDHSQPADVVPHRRMVRLLDFHPDLGADLDPAGFERARRLIGCPLVEAGPGPWEPSAVRSHGVAGRVFACVVVDGLLAREVVLAGRGSVSLYGRRDVIGLSELAGASPGVSSAFTALTPVRLAVLDDRFLKYTQRWPYLAARLTESIIEQVGGGCVRQAVSQLPRAEDRLVALFWMLADRWGHVGPEGIVLDLPLTHEALGQLIGARRPTVSLAMRELDSAGHLERRPNGGGWLLSRSSLERLEVADQVAWVSGG